MPKGNCAALHVYHTVCPALPCPALLRFLPCPEKPSVPVTPLGLPVAGAGS